MQIVLDDFLDDIPTNAQVHGDILNGHHLRQFQNVLGETSGVAASRVGELDGRLTNGLAIATLNPWDAKRDSYPKEKTMNEVTTEKEVLAQNAEIYRELTSQHPEIVDVLILLAAMEAVGHGAMDVLSIIREEK